MNESIQQSDNGNTHLIAILEILRSGYWYDKKVQAVLKPFGISHEQYNVLRILEHNHPRQYSLKEIQSRLMNKTPNTTRLVEKLRVKGYVQSSYSPINRRMLQIGITGEGMELLKQIKGPILDMGGRVQKVLNERDARALIRILRRFRTMQ